MARNDRDPTSSARGKKRRVDSEAAVAPPRQRPNISLKQIWAFLLVAETENFTAAADALCTTQSAVSNLIKDMERELDLRLFERTTRSVSLTAAGQEFREPARRVMAEFEATMAKATMLAEQRRGQVTIAASPMMAGLLLPPVLADFHGTNPGINVVIRDAPYDQIRRIVLEGKADIGFSLMPMTTPGLTGEMLMSGELNLLVNSGHPLESRDVVTWKDIAEYPFIALTIENGTRQIAEQCAAEAGVTLKLAYEVSFIWTAISMVEAGLGLCVVPAYAKALGARRQSVLRPIEGINTKAAIALVTRSDGQLSAGALRFCQFMRDYVR